mmetsp:Transcript_15287/g.46195  ORF Transcript_15287/g.46195 Transcript_15287/m.46195 type:complete len:171 (-) Transcript_15287:773-1285(-)
MQALQASSGMFTGAGPCSYASGRVAQLPQRSFAVRAIGYGARRHVGPKSRQSSVSHAKPRKVSAEDLEVELAKRSVPMIIDFYATWCGPCVLLAKELEQVAEELGDSVQILKVDTDENTALSTQLMIQGLPTMIFVGLNPDQPAIRTEGLLPAATIKEIVANELNKPVSQ